MTAAKCRRLGGPFAAGFEPQVSNLLLSAIFECGLGIVQNQHRVIFKCSLAIFQNQYLAIFEYGRSFVKFKTGLGVIF
ncbi:hypothetical protein [Hafnia psychrotolerans]